MAERNPVDSRNQLYPRCNRDALVEDETGISRKWGSSRASLGSGNETGQTTVFSMTCVQAMKCTTAYLFLKTMTQCPDIISRWRPKREKRRGVQQSDSRYQRR